MPRENAEIVRRAFAAFSSDGLEALFDFLDPEVEIVEAAPDGTVYRGHRGYLAAAENWVGTWDDFRNEVEEVVVGDDDRVLVCCKQRGRIKGSGGELSARVAYVFDMRDGKAVRWRVFWDMQKARRALES